MSKINKLVTNYPVTLTPAEVNNLSQTLSSVRTAGGSGDQQYLAGDSNINVDNEHYRISFTQHATELLERDIPSAVSQLTDSANYVTNSLLETVSGEIVDLIPSNYVTSGNYISGNSQYALTSGGWTKITGGGGSITGDYVPLSAEECVIGEDNVYVDQHILVQGRANSAEYNSFVQGYGNSGKNYTISQGRNNIAFDSSIAQGYNNYASAKSIAQGSNNKANDTSLAQGTETSAYEYSLAQGLWNYASAYSQAQGKENSAIQYSFAEGLGNYASAQSLAQGNSNTAKDTSFAQGAFNLAQNNAFAYGQLNSATDTAYAIGSANSVTSGSFAVGKGNSAFDQSIALEDQNYASGRSMAVGHASSAKNYSFTFGRGLDYSGPSTSNFDLGAFVVGGWNSLNTWTGTTATAPLFIVGNGGGNNTRNNAFIVYRNGAISEGTSTVANGNNSHAEGINTSAYGGQSHAEGNATYCLGDASHTEGMWAYTSGQGDHAEGVASTAVGYGIHAQGCWTEFSSTLGTPPADSTGSVGSDQVGVFVGGIYNATTSHDYGEATAHRGVLAVFGNGIRRNSNNYVKSDAFLLYRDGTVSAKDYLAAGYTDTNSVYHEAYIPKAIPNTADNSMKVQKMFVCTSDADIVAHAVLANGEGCVFFRIG